MSDESGQVEGSPFDLANHVEEGCYLVGFAAVLKVIDTQGRQHTQFLLEDMNPYEAVGVLQAHVDMLRAMNTANLMSSDEAEYDE